MFEVVKVCFPKERWRRVFVLAPGPEGADGFVLQRTLQNQVKCCRYSISLLVSDRDGTCQTFSHVFVSVFVFQTVNT